MKPRIEFKDNLGEFSISGAVDDFTFFKRAVRIFSSSFLEDVFHLTDRELELLYCIALFKKLGDGDIFSKTNINKFFPSFGSKRLLQVWLPKLEKKFWITFTKSTVDFKHTKVLDFLNKDKVLFNIYLKKEDSG